MTLPGRYLSHNFGRLKSYDNFNLVEQQRRSLGEKYLFFLSFHLRQQFLQILVPCNEKPKPKPRPGILKLEFGSSGDSSTSEKSDADADADELLSKSSPGGEEKSSMFAASKHDGEPLSAVRYV